MIRNPFFQLSGCFNPRSREGNDIIASILLISPNSFNPRSREGND